MNGNRKWFTLMVFAAGLALGTGLLVINKSLIPHNYLFAETNSVGLTNERPAADEDNYFKYFSIFREAYDVLRHEFFDGNRVSAKNLFYGALKGMLESTGDPYTTFMEPAAAREFGNDISANFVGLGINIDIRDGYLTVVSPIEDSPASRAGIKSGDRITAIEGVSTKNITSEEAARQLKGIPGSEVNLTIVREGIKDPIGFTIKRGQVHVKTVDFAVIPSDGKTAGYIRVKEFSVPTPGEFKLALLSIMSNKPDELIVDLRNNPGGLLQAAVSMVNDLVDGGLVVFTRGRLPENNQDYYASKGEMITPLSLPVVVLINEGSASASEIFTGAMMDDQRAVVVGVKSYGKGSVQKTYSFPDDGSTIKYTVAKYYTPSGRSIDKIGITPDVPVKIWYEDLPESEKNALVKAESTNIVRDYLSKNPQTGENRDQFSRFLADQGFILSRKSADWLIKEEIYTSSQPPVYDLQFDDQLKAALEVAARYSDYKKLYRVYNEAKIK